jgi:putative DNA primase/helicase
MADKSRQTSANTRSRTPIANGHDPDAVLPKLQERSEDSNDDPRPVIQLFSGKLSAAADEAAALLAAAGVELYRRGGTLVRPVIQSTARPAKGSPDSLALVLVSRASLLDTLSRHIRFDRYNGKSGVWVPVNPPQQLAEILLAREGEWPFPPIAGVLTAPTLRPDGSLLAEAGYDPATRFYVFNPPALGPVPENPTRADAEAALALLLDLLVEFPFTSEAGRSVALSLLITPLVRSMMTTAPLHCVVAPEAGTGKSYLVDTAAAALLGYRCPVFSASTREEETEKRLAGSLIDGRPMISIDNVNGVLRGDLLCQAIVRPVVDVRPLGTSRKVRVENHATFVATGNNLRLEGDLTRRAILCYLDAGAARPELRAFTQSPFDEMLQDRGHVIAAALTLVRAYIC